MPKVALIQLSAEASQQSNIEKTHKAIREAAEAGAQIISTQELFTSLYFCRDQDPSHFALAETIPSDTITQQQELAKELGVVIVASGFEKRATGLYHIQLG